MSASTGSMLVLLILAINIIIYTEASPQGSNSLGSSLSDEDLINLFGQSLPGTQKNGNQGAVNTSNNVDQQLVSAIGGSQNTECDCTPRNQCRDQVQSAAIVSGNIFETVDIRATSCFDVLEVCCFNRGPAIKQETPSHDPGCGLRNPRGVGINIRGFEDNQAQYAEFPWTAAVLKPVLVNGKNVKGFSCGGSLIHPRIVVTVAHCVTEINPNEIIVRLGEWNINSTSETHKHVERNVQNIIIHPNFQEVILGDDVALLILSSDVPLQANIGTICLPNAGETFDGSKCYSSGWGKDVFGEKGRFQSILKKVEVPAVNHNKCEASLRTTRLSQAFNLHNTFMCAGGAGQDTCEGDGGSPLACPNKRNPERYTLAGAVAWGIGCGRKGIPGVYASISEAIDWIKSVASSRVGVVL